MACVLVPIAEAAVTTVVAKVIKSKENKAAKLSPLGGSNEGEAKIKLSTKLGWLNKMLWGGSVLLAFEHIWHGEIVPFFPFVTAASNGQTADMLAEMSTSGVAMAALVTVAWLGVVAVCSALEKREAKEACFAREDA